MLAPFIPNKTKDQTKLTIECTGDFVPKYFGTMFSWQYLALAFKTLQTMIYWEYFIYFLMTTVHYQRYYLIWAERVRHFISGTQRLPLTETKAFPWLLLPTMYATQHKYWYKYFCKQYCARFRSNWFYAYILYKNFRHYATISCSVNLVLQQCMLWNNRRYCILPELRLRIFIHLSSIATYLVEGYNELSPEGTGCNAKVANALQCTHAYKISHNSDALIHLNTNGFGGNLCKHEKNVKNVQTVAVRWKPLFDNCDCLL